MSTVKLVLVSSAATAVSVTALAGCVLPVVSKTLTVGPMDIDGVPHS
jgi:hypothetical protein